MGEGKLFTRGDAVLSDCGTWRYRLDRRLQSGGPVVALFGVNPSTADADIDDATIRKWTGFTKRFGGSRFIVGNAFAFRATDVRKLAAAADPRGPQNDHYLWHIMFEADVLVPCWGNESKVPERLRYQFVRMREKVFAAGKPVKVFGLTESRCPKHPLMLGYDTPLIDWSAALTKGPSNG